MAGRLVQLGCKQGDQRRPPVEKMGLRQHSFFAPGAMVGMKSFGAPTKFGSRPLVLLILLLPKCWNIFITQYGCLAA